MVKATDDAKEQRAREGPKKTTGGNTKADQAWIAELADELHPVDTEVRPDGFLWDVSLQWEGYADEVNVDFFLSFLRWPDQRRCNGTAYVRDERGGYIVDCEWTRITRPCLKLPAKGGVVCHAHGASIPVVKAAAERVLATAAEVVAIRLVGLTGTMDEISQAIDHKVRLAAANSVLDRVGIKGGTTVEVQLPGYKKVLSDMFGGAEGSDGDDE